MPLPPGRKAVMGAQSLHLNFINLFTVTLRLADVRLAPEALGR
jgi:FtsH-binding integral membrane protein